MIRPAAALLLSAAAILVQADDPSLPRLPPLNSSPTPIADPGPSLGASPSVNYSAPSSTYSATPEYSTSGSYSSEHSVQSQYPVQSEYPIQSEYPVKSGPIVSDPLPVYSNVPYSAAPAAGCGCQNNATVYSGSSLGLPVGDAGVYGGSMVGYQAMGYHGGGMETYTGAVGGGMHVRHPYYSYRRPWYANGPMSHNVNIAW